MTVSIDIDLDAWDAHMELGILKQEIESLEESLDLDFGDLDSLDETIEGLADSLDDLGDKFDGIGADFKADIDDAVNRIENADVDGFRVQGGDTGGRTGSDSGDGNAPVPRRDGYSIVDTVKIIAQDVDVFGPNGVGGGGGFGGARSDGGSGFHQASRLGATTTALPGGSGGGGGSGIRLGGGGGGGGGGGSGDGDLIDLPGSGAVHKQMKGMKNPIKKAIPSMRVWYNLIAASIPALAAFAVQAAGVASAMGAVGAAGAAVIGLGLIGHGDSMSESFANARQQLSELGSELFNVFEPAADAFAPIQEKLFDALPDQMRGVADAMAGLTVYEDTLLEMFSGLTGWLEKAVDGLVENEEVVSQLALRFGSIAGSNVLDFFGWLTDEAYKNQDALIELGQIMKLFLLALYDIFLAASKLLIVFKPVFELFRYLASLLHNSLVVGILSGVAAFGLFSYAAISAMKSVSGLVTMLSSGLIPGLTSAFYMLHGYTFNILMATSATYTFAKSIATLISVATLLTGIGIAGWAGYQAYQGMKKVNQIENKLGGGGGAPIGSPGPGGGSGTTIINQGDKYDVDVSGDTDNATKETVRDTVKLSNSSDSARDMGMGKTTTSGGTNGRDTSTRDTNGN